MLNNFKINVAVYDRTAALAASPTYAKWAALRGEMSTVYPVDSGRQ